MSSRIITELSPEESSDRRETMTTTPERAVVSERVLPNSLVTAEKLAALRTELSGARTRLLQERISHSVQRASAEQANRVSEAATQFATDLLQNITQPMLQVAEHGRILRWNDAIAELTGISAEVALGRNLHQVFMLEQTTQLTQEIHRFQNGETDKPLAGTLSGASPLHYVLLPQFRIAHCLETVVILFRCEAVTGSFASKIA